MTQDHENNKIQVVVEAFASLIDECLEIGETKIESNSIEVEVVDEEGNKINIRYKPTFTLIEV